MLSHDYRDVRNTNMRTTLYNSPSSSSLVANDLMHGSLKGAAVTMPPHSSVKSLTSSERNAIDNKVKGKNDMLARRVENGNASTSINDNNNNINGSSSINRSKYPRK